DGTLEGFKTDPKLAIPGADTMELLNELAADVKNSLVIISGRDKTTLGEWFGKMPITLIAEHGAFMKRANSNEWQMRIMGSSEWKKELLPVLHDFTRRCPLSFIEEKEHSIAWHYRKCDDELGFIRSRQLIDTIANINPQILAIDGRKVIEFKVEDFNKGEAALKMRSEAKYDFVLAIGDDRTDEKMFEALRDDCTIKVGPEFTNAKYRLANHLNVKAFLKQLGLPRTIAA
ncbi:MAG TPA: trehalose-phosphatase, partial [Chitinophagales bacterium]|nr:trehalose-phosphatase [Chitinophagales bacterium]